MWPRSVLLAFSIAILSLGLLVHPGCSAEDGPDDDDVADDDAADDDVSGDDDVSSDDDTADDDAADDDAADDDAAAAAPNIVAVPAALEFGEVTVGDSADLPLEIVNTGDGPLHVMEMASSLDFVTFHAYTGPIAPGSSEFVAVTATCVVASEFVGNLVVFSDDPDEHQFIVPLDVVCVEA